MHADNAQDRIKDCTEAFFNEMSKYADKRDLDTPQTAVYTPTTFRREDPEEIVTQPSKLVRTDNPVKQFFFDETAEWLASSNAGFDFPPALDPEQTDDIAGYYRKRLFEFAQLTLDYTGQFGFSESDFYAAYRDHIKPKYQAKHTHRIVVPLPGLSLHDTANLRQEKLSLPNQIDIDSVGRNRCELPSEVEISRLTDWELAGVQTYGSPHVTSDLSTLRRKLRWYYKLMIDIEIEDLPAAHEERRPGIDRSWTSLLAKQIGIRIAKQLVTVLRLFEPRNYVGIGPAYVTERSWLTHRNLCMDISGYFSSSDSQETPIVKLERYQLDRENYDELNSFWRKLATACDPKADTELSSAIRRFNQTFKSKSYEDKIVDSYIGFEKTLANNEGVSSFRFPARAALLFQNEPLHFRNSAEMSLDFVYELTDDLQNKRNGIIHDDAELNMGKFDSHRELPENPFVSDLSSYEFTLEARYFLSQAIQRYWELLKEYETSIRDINREIVDPKILNALTEPLLGGRDKI